MNDTIKNTYFFDGISGCNSGQQYCSDGYTLLFPCLKSITRGQNACFDFYIMDNSTKSLVDLRDVDDITLSLSGSFGCGLGSFSYPENISSEQIENYPIRKSYEFDDMRKCDFIISSIFEGDISDHDIEKQYYSGTKIILKANDTSTHIFIGWCDDSEIEACENTLYDLITNPNNEYEFIINKDTQIFALYRKRKEYEIRVSDDNQNSHFDIIFDDANYPISNKENEISKRDGLPYDDCYDYVNILEGYYFNAICEPNIIEFDANDSSDDNYAYKFLKWKDGDPNRWRTFCAGADTGDFENGNKIYLEAYCYDPNCEYTVEELNKPIPNNIFKDTNIEIIPNEIQEYFDYTGSEDIKVLENSNIKKCINGLYVDNGSLILKSNIENGIRVSISTLPIEDCKISVKLNNTSAEQVIDSTSDDEFVQYSYTFRKCENSDIEIKVDGKCIIQSIDICREEIYYEGMAKLCLDSKTTFNLPKGKLNVNGAINIGGEIYGIPSVQIGEVNNLNKIDIL